MAEGVVDLLEAVEIDEDERDTVAVAGGALQLELELPNERLMVQQPGQLVMPRLVRELRRRSIEVGHDALRHEPVDRRVQPLLHREHLAGTEPELARAAGDESPQDTAQEQELGDDLPRREAVRLAL